MTDAAGGPADAWAAAVDRVNRLGYLDVARRSGGRVETDGGVTMAIGVHPSPVIANVAFRTGPVDEGMPDRVEARYAEVGHRASFITSDATDADAAAALAARGWRDVYQMPAMLLRGPVADEPAPPGVEPRWVDPDLDLAAFRRLMIAGFAEDDDEVSMIGSVLARPASVGPPGAALMALAGDRPVSGGMVYRVEDAALIAWIATVPDARRRGLARYVTRQLINRGFELGAGWATLEASTMGRSVYERLGFETVGWHRLWAMPAD